MAETIAQIAVEVGDIQDHTADTLWKAVIEKYTRGFINRDQRDILLRRITAAESPGVHATTHG